MSENKFVSLYEKYEAGKCSPEEISYLENFKDDYHLDDYPWTPEMGDKAQIWASLYARLKYERETPVKTTKIRRLAWWSAAAAALIICFASLGLYYMNHSKRAQDGMAVRFETHNGEKKQIRLVDGTVIHLNAKSLLVLEKGFNQEARNVQLTGEAFFDVAHNKDLPFTVHTTDFDIHVTGTAFNVKAYPDEKSSTATLIRGRIFMEPTGAGDKPVLLKPGEKVTVLKIPPPATGEKKPARDNPELVSLTHYTQSQDSTIVETAWTQNRLSIYEQDFKDMKGTLERWFDVKIIINSESVEHYHFTATFTTESLDDVLMALQKVQYFKYEINQKTVTIGQ